mmetsp:Transcript_4653/g.21142  ORF Transcript_4653/g.21142 Transcript_4653/m.21142 type:complete len:242 (-) Transcript_4653:507-1232(-)
MTYALSRYSKNESHPAPMPPLRTTHVPRCTSSVFPSKSRSPLMDHMERIAPRAARSNLRSPLSLDNIPNSSMNDPTAATFVSLVSPARTPCRRLTHAYGIPVLVPNALSRRSPRSSAFGSKPPVYSGMNGGPIDRPTPPSLSNEDGPDPDPLPFPNHEPDPLFEPDPFFEPVESPPSPSAMTCAERSPARTRILHSNALTLTSMSKSRLRSIHRTFRANSVLFPSTASVEVASMSVSATPA